VLKRETQNAEAAALFGFQVKKWIGAFSSLMASERMRPDLLWVGILGNRVEKTKLG
jgi:hypothetical protein